MEVATMAERRDTMNPTGQHAKTDETKSKRNEPHSSGTSADPTMPRDSRIGSASKSPQKGTSGASSAGTSDPARKAVTVVRTTSNVRDPLPEGPARGRALGPGQ